MSETIRYKPQVHKLEKEVVRLTMLLATRDREIAELKDELTRLRVRYGTPVGRLPDVPRRLDIPLGPSPSLPPRREV